MSNYKLLILLGVFIFSNDLPLAVFSQSSIPTTQTPPTSTTAPSTPVPTSSAPTTVSTSQQSTSTIITTNTPTTPFPDEGHNCTVNGPFPHPVYCEYYYQCTNGVDTLIKCGSNMLFDLKYYGCNYPELTDCQDRERPPGYPGTITPPEGSTTTGGPPTFICPPENGHYPDPDDCTAFYQCDQGNAYRYVCPFPLHYDSDLRVCNHPGSVNCGSRPIP